MKQENRSNKKDAQVPPLLKERGLGGEVYKAGEVRRVRFLFIDRDGTINKERPPTYQIDSFNKLEFVPGVFTWLGKIVRELDFKLIMVTNQDGLGTESFPEKTFWPIHNFIINTLENEGIVFDEVYIDKSFIHENSPNRKPGTGMLKSYLNNSAYDLVNSYVIGDRETDIELAKNLGTKSFLISETNGWETIYRELKLKTRTIQHIRNTNETRIDLFLNLDGQGKYNINTGVNFLDHMLEQFSRHSSIDINLTVQGDLYIDEHHTIEDTAIALGEAFALSLGDKMGINRYGFLLPMDDCLAQVSIDFGGRPWLVWGVEFKREKIGDMPTEMFHHFFKSFTDTAKCNLNIQAHGENEHHKIESIFKAFAKSVQQAISRDLNNNQIPTTKGKL